MLKERAELQLLTFNASFLHKDDALVSLVHVGVQRNQYAYNEVTHQNRCSRSLLDKRTQVNWKVLSDQLDSLSVFSYRR